eukprot:288152_1
MTDVLWLVKFDKYDLNSTSLSNPYIPRKCYDFYSKFKACIQQKNDISLIYFAGNGPYIMDRPQTDLPRKDWNVTIITKHDTDNISIAFKAFIKSKDFNALKQEFGITNIYNIYFQMDEKRIQFLKSPKIANKILSRAPSYPYTKSSQFDSQNKNNKAINNFVRFIRMYNKPFLMLNLMQIIDEKEDQIYSRKCGPLIWGLSGNIPIIGNAKKIENYYWTELLLVHYPSPSAFWNMWTSEHYMKIGHHKRNSTKDVFLQVTIPIYCDPKYLSVEKQSKL